MSNLSSQLRYDGKVVIVTGAGGTPALPLIRDFKQCTNVDQVVLEERMLNSSVLVVQVLL